MPKLQPIDCISTAIVIAECLATQEEHTYEQPVMIKRGALGVLAMAALKHLAMNGVDDAEGWAIANALDALASPTAMGVPN